MSATIVPVTTGGMKAWIQRGPAKCTATPAATRSRPAVTSADGWNSHIKPTAIGGRSRSGPTRPVNTSVG